MADDTERRLSVRSTPHIRLNSGRHEPYVDLEEGTRELEHQLSNRSQRSLVPPERRSTVIAAAPELPSPPIISPPIISPTDSSELLFPPPRKVRSRGSPDRSTLISAISYQRNSWDSHSDTGSRDSRGFPFDPFVDSTCPSRADSDDENVNTQTVSEKYNIMPTEGLLLFPEDVEKDDYLHNPDAADRDRVCDMCNTRGVFNIGGLAFLTIGIVALFIVYPVTYEASCPIMT
jgi:hypothetical protein